MESENPIYRVQSHTSGHILLSGERQCSGGASRFLFRGSDAVTNGTKQVVKFPAADAMQNMRRYFHQEQVEYTIVGFCNSVLQALKRAGILLPDGSMVDMVDIQHKSTRDDADADVWTAEPGNPSLAFIQNYHPSIEDERNHHTGFLPLLGKRNLQEFAAVDQERSVLFDWDWMFDAYLEHMRSTIGGRARTMTGLWDYCTYIADATPR